MKQGLCFIVLTKLILNSDYLYNLISLEKNILCRLAFILYSYVVMCYWSANQPSGMLLVLYHVASRRNVISGKSHGGAVMYIYWDLNIFGNLKITVA